MFLPTNSGPEKTIQEWIDVEVRDQLFSYGLSREMNPDSAGRSFRAFAAVLVGERRRAGSICGRSSL